MPAISETLIHYDLNAYAAIFVVAVLITMHVRRNTVAFGSRLFRRILAANLAMLLLEISAWLFDGHPGNTARTLNYLTNWIYLWLNPLIPCLWAAYIDYRTLESRERLRRRWYYMYPMIVSTAFMIINFFYPLVFTLDAENVYHRVWGLWVLFGVGVLVFPYLLGFALRHRNRMRHTLVIVLMILVTVPILGALAGMFMYGMMLVWPLLTMVVVIAYILIENHNASIDNLTGAFSRLRAEEHIRHLVESRLPFTLISFDLDDFKLINDRHGHLAGDHALICFTGTLEQLCGRNMMVARFGGDEFVVVTRVTDEEVITSLIQRFNEKLKYTNPESQCTRPLRASAGFVIYDPRNKWSYDQLFSIVDERMYTDKSSRKNLHRRRSDRI